MRLRMCVALGLLVCSTALLAPAAAAQDRSGAQRPKQGKQQANKQRQKKPAQARVKPGAQVRAQPRAQQPAAAKASTDTESRITKAGGHVFSIQHGGLTRTYRVHVPARYDPAVPAPLLVALHGEHANMDPQAADSYYGLAGKSEREGFLVAFPHGITKQKAASWNAGNCCGAARDDKVDDVGFIRQVVTNVFRQASIDRNRIFAVGMSNGAMMAYRLACEMPQVFRAVAAVAGTDNSRECTPGNPVAVLHIHAKDDPQVPFDGAAAAGTADRAEPIGYASVPATMSKWAQLNGCTAQPRRILEQAGAYCEAHSYCRGRAEVQLCVTDAGGHSWPGGKAPPGEAAPSRAISATDLMWNFFSHR
jgi:polyhydroxybutyrate depolymerase